MHPLVKQLTALIRSHGLLSPGDTVVVAISGGPDSMALLHLLARLDADWRLSLVPVYVDHGLRPAETPAEAALVREQAASLQLEARVAGVDVPAHMAQHGSSLEETARLLRYRALEQVAAEVGAQRIAVAHTADDQAEELLIRLLRGTGRKGLAGMALMREERIIRPLLETTKASLLDFLAENNIPHAEDSSNRQRDFLRNRIRLDLIPYLEEHFNPNVRATLHQTAAILAAEEELLEDRAREAYGRLVIEEKERSALSLAAEPFNQLPLAIRRRVLEMAFWQVDCRPGFKQIEQLLQLCEKGCEGSSHFEQGLRARLAHGRLSFSYPKGRTGWRGEPEAGGRADFRVMLNGPGHCELPALGCRVRVEETAAAGIDFAAPPADGVMLSWLAAESVSFPLVFRPVRAGDRIHPLGAPGSKKVNDWLTDKKIPSELRWREVVVESDGRVVALLGRTVDQCCRVEPDSRRVLKLRLEHA